MENIYRQNLSPPPVMGDDKHRELLENPKALLPKQKDEISLDGNGYESRKDKRDSHMVKS